MPETLSLAGRAMRLAIVRARYTPFGGAERVINRLIGVLAERGVDVTVLARRWSAEAAESLPKSVRWQRIDPFFVGNATRMRGFARAVRRAINAQRFDLVQSHERIPGVSLYRAGDGVHRRWLELRQRVRGRLYGYVAGLSPAHRWQLYAERAMFEDPSLRCVVCNSEMVRNEIATEFGLPRQQLRVIRNGVDLQAFQPPSEAQRHAARRAHGVDDRTPVLLFVGSGFERKGLAAAMRALAGVPEAVLLVVGHDRDAGKYKRFAAELGVGERVRLLGPLRDVRSCLHAADVFVLPAVYDPMPNAVLEAMACALPVVTTHQCGAAELLSESSGAVVDAFDQRALTDAVARFSDRAAARAAGLHARAAVEPYSLQRMADAYLALYAELLDVKR